MVAVDASVLERPASAGRVARTVVSGLGLCAVIAVIGFFSLSLGEPRLGPGALWTLLTQSGGGLEDAIVTDLRMPRLITGLACGMALGIAGLVLQDSLRNPIAGPELLGVSAGAAVAVVATIVFADGVALLVRPLFGVVGGLAGGAAVLIAAGRTRDPVRITLIGAIMSSLLSAVLLVEIGLGRPQEISAILTYLVGSLRGVGWSEVTLVVPVALVGVVLVAATGRYMNLLRLDEEVAEGLGLRVARARLLYMVASAVVVAVVVAVAGPIGFVSLLAPHLARRILRSGDGRIVAPITALVGGAILVAADVVARQLFYPYDVPVGIWLTVIGAPLLLAVLRRQTSGRPA